MTTTEMYITGRGFGMKEALEATEAFGLEQGLTGKSVLQLRLLAEELFGMLSLMGEEAEAEYWITSDGSRFQLHLKSFVEMTDKMKKQMAAAAFYVGGKKEETEIIGFKGRLRKMIERHLLNPEKKNPLDSSISLISTGWSLHPLDRNHSETKEWTMERYKAEVRKHLGDTEEAIREWDELEKSVIARVADDVKIELLGSDVEITIFKSF